MHGEYKNLSLLENKWYQLMVDNVNIVVVVIMVSVAVGGVMVVMGRMVTSWWW